MFFNKRKRAQQMFYRPQLFEGRLALNTGLASVSSNSKHLRRSIPFTAAHAYIAHIWQDLNPPLPPRPGRYHADHQPSKPFHYHTQFKSRFRCTQPLRSKYAIIIVIYRKNHPPFPLNCYLYAQQTYRTLSPKLRLLLVHTTTLVKTSWDTWGNQPRRRTLLN